MEYSWCPKCKRYTPLPCGCVPFMVYYPEYFGEDKEVYYGYNFDAVAERIAEEINSDNPVFDRNTFETPIEITDQNGITKRYNCQASISIDYFIKEITD